MRRLITAIALLSVVSFGLVGCGSDSGDNAAGTQEHTISVSSCPTDNTKAFPKARFAANVGLIAGSFHRWIWKPYKAGKFKKGADGRILATAKAVATALFIKHEVGNAVDNVRADPTLCKLLATPMSTIQTMVDKLGSSIKGGDVGTLIGLNGALGTLTGLLAKNGMPVTETSKN